MSIFMDVPEVAALKVPRTHSVKKVDESTITEKTKRRSKHLRGSNRDIHLDLGQGLPRFRWGDLGLFYNLL